MAMGNRSMGKTMSPVIFHIDVNSAYLSWTAVEQLKNGAEVDLRDPHRGACGQRVPKMPQSGNGAAEP